MLSVKKIVTNTKLSVKTCGARRLKFVAFLLLMSWVVWCWPGPGDPALPRRLRKYLRFPEGHVLPDLELTNSDVQQLKQKLGLLNVDIELRNSDQFSPVSANTTFIVVQVHRGAERLQYLLVSLAQVRDIDSVLLIFSHSYYDDSLNELIQSIDFCKVIQVFYPYSLQLHPDRFPGVDAADGFDRDARRSERKQHWWWKAHFIFSGSIGTPPPRDVIFLEEDDYVLPDMLFIYRYSRRLLEYFPAAEVIALGGGYADGAPGRVDYDSLLVGLWTPTYDRGLAFNASTWRKIVSRADRYCRFDDCSWSHSLAHVFGGLAGRSVDVVASMAPRVLATRARGGAGWAGGAAGAAAAAGRLFPRSLRAAVLLPPGRRELLPPQPHVGGGWADARDQQLCLDLLNLDRTDAPPDVKRGAIIRDAPKYWNFLLRGNA